MFLNFMVLLGALHFMLLDKLTGTWQDITLIKVEMPWDCVGEVVIRIYELGNRNWKRGLAIKSVSFIPEA